MASAGVKLGLMFRDSAVLLAHQNVSSPVYVGAWLAVILLVVTGYTAFVRQTVLSRLLHPGRSFRRFLLVAVTVGVLGGAAAPYSLSGFGWWGGPLSSPTEFGSGLGLGVRERPNHSVPIIEGAAYVHNLSWTAATLDDLRLSNGDSSLRLVRSYVLVYGGGPCPNGAVRFPPIDACGEPLGGYRVPTSSPGSQLQVVPVLEATAPGRYRVRSFRLDYHVGFLHFAMTEVEDIRFCAPGRGVRCGSRSGRRP
jgi:hypothetical protein